MGYIMEASGLHIELTNDGTKLGPHPRQHATSK